MLTLVPCRSCERHVDVSETTCPFCSRALPVDLASRVIPGTTRRLNRLAMFTFATTLTAAGAIASGCDNGSTAAAYGIPPGCSEPNCVVDSGPKDDGGPGALYGLPGFVDSGSDADDAAITNDSGDAD